MASATTRRPRVTLTQDAVVRGATALADADGLPAVTMSRLAQSLGVTTMALYWHFKDKDELLAAMGGSLFSEVSLAPLTGEPWDAEIETALLALVTALSRHPAVAGLALTTVLGSDAGLALAERILSQLTRGGFAPDDAAQLGIFLLGSVVTLVTTEPGPADNLSPEEQDAYRRQKRADITALSPDRYPTVVTLADSLVDCADQTTYLGRGVELLVGGLRALS